MNNKAQVLVVFVLVLPIILLICFFVVDMGLLLNEKRKIEYSVKETIEYGFKNSDDDVISDMKRLLNANIEAIDNLDIVVSDNHIMIKLDKKHKSIFNIVYSKAQYEIKQRYYGYKEADKLVIRKGEVTWQ